MTEREKDFVRAVYEYILDDALLLYDEPPARFFHLGKYGEVRLTARGDVWTKDNKIIWNVNDDD